MKHHFVKTDNYRNLIDGVAYMESRGSLTTCLCLVHGDPGVGKTRNISPWGPDAPAIFIRKRCLKSRSANRLAKSLVKAEPSKKYSD